MTTTLRVQVLLYSTLVEDRVLTVGHSVALGESEGADVAFPGASLRVWRHTNGDLWLRDAPLAPGAPVTVHLGAVTVTLEALRPTPSALPGMLLTPLPDVRLFLASTAVVLLAAFLDSAEHFAHTDPVASAQIAAWFGDAGPALAGDRPQIASVETDAARPSTPPAPSRNANPDAWPTVRFLP